MSGAEVGAASSVQATPRPEPQPLEMLQGWFRATRALLAGTWQQHVVPVVAWMGLVMVSVMALMALSAAVFVAAAVLEEEWMLLLAMAVVVLGSMAMGFGLGLVNYGYLHAVMRSLDTGRLDLRELVPPWPVAGGLVGVYALTMVAVFGGMLLCYVPGLLAGLVLGLAPALFLVRQRGVGDALIASVQVMRRWPADVLGLHFAKFVAMMFVAFIPAVGGFLMYAMLPVVAVIDCVAAKTLSARLDGETLGAHAAHPKRPEAPGSEE